MQYTAVQLKEKLVEGIDNENNVVDMPKVLQVVCILERYPVTREILEETRIGRLVNDIRRKTSDKQLAKRAKELVRSWQRVINGVSEVPTSVNGEGLGGGASVQHRSLNKTAVSPAGSITKSASATQFQRSVTPNTVKSSLSPGQLPSKPSTPSLPNASQKHSAQNVAKRSISSPHLYAPSAKRLCTPPIISSQPGTPDSVSSQGSRASYTAGVNEHFSPSSHSSNHRTSKMKRTQSSDTLLAHQHQAGDLRTVQSASCFSPDIGEDSNSGLNGVVIKSNGGADTPTHSIESKGLKTTIRFNRTSPPVPMNGVLETPIVKRGRGRPPKNRPSFSEDNSQISNPSPAPKPPANGSSRVTPPNGSTSKSLSERKNARLGILTDIDTPSRAVSLTPKVKNTAELIQSLQAKNSLSVGKETAQRIQSNMIYKEVDRVPSIVPDGVKPRPHQKKGAKNDIDPPSTPVSLKTKKEMVEKFLETSVQRSSPDDLSPLKYELPRTESPGNGSTSFEDSVEGNHESASNNNLMDVSVYDQRSKSVKKRESSPKPGCSTELEHKDRPLSLDEIYSRYPPLDLDNFVIDDDTYEMSEPVEVGDDDIERLHSSEWAGVNGYRDAWGDWTNWANTLSLQSYNGDYLHILPYVNTDD